MNYKSVVRYGGLAAIVSAVLYIASIGFWMSGSAAAAPPPAATLTYAASSVVFLVTLYALYLIHRAEAQALTLVGIAVMAGSAIASLFVNTSDTGNPLLVVLAVGYGLGALILGWLAYRSPRLRPGIGIAALLTGVLSLVMVPFMLAGASDLVGLLNLILSVPYLVWLFWLGWHCFTGKAAGSLSQ
jgi:hypothetical protein